MRRKCEFPTRESRISPWLFSFSWERRKLGEIAQIRTGFPFDSKDFSSNGVFLVVTNGNIQDENPCVDNSMGNRIDVPEEQIKAQYVLDIGDILVTMDGTVGRTAKVAHNQLILAQRVGRLTAYGNPEFLYQALSSGSFFESMTSLAHGGTIKHISLAEISNFDLFLPKSEMEQETIGRFFYRIDTLITLHQRKQNVYVTKSIFAVDIKTFAWERRKLGELIEDYVERTTIQNQYPVLTSSQHHGIVLQEAYFADRQVTTNDNIGYFVLPKGYFTYRSRSDTDVFVFNRNDILDKGIISYYYPVFRAKNIDSDFLLRRLNHGTRPQLSMAAEGTGQKVLAHTKFKDITVAHPTEEEQRKIGAIFKVLDRLITLHQRK